LQQHKRLSNQQQQRLKTLAKLNTSIRNKDQQLKKLHKDRNHLERLFKEVSNVIITDNHQTAVNQQPFNKLRGKLPWPTIGRVSHKFGSSRNVGNLRWNGVMIKAQQGADVRAIHAGRVIFSDYLRGHGLLLIIDHGDDYMSLYAHNQTLFKDTGEIVVAGEVIANVGNSGGLSSAALYFEIRHRGKPTNPAHWCKINT
jgi:murein hydrolase activator